VTLTDLPLALLRFALILPAIILHEVAHGYVAYLLGDTTARDRGRLTLNPMAHIDLWGTVLMPALLLLTSGGRFAFGYAKPVPVNPYQMSKVGHRNGMLLTGIAGPVTNIVLAVMSGLLTRVLTVVPGIPEVVSTVTVYFCYINLVLAFFNLIPLPPMDGSRVAQRFLSGAALEWYSRIEPYGFFVIIALIWIVPQVTGIDPIGAYLDVTVVPIAQLLIGG
jgi:Zn-dependent protease